MQHVLWMVLVVLIMARPATAGFEGALDMTMTMKDGSGTLKGLTSAVGMRVEVEARTPQTGSTPLQLTLLMKWDNPQVVTLLNATTKTYTELTPQDLGRGVKQRPEKDYAVKKLGKEKIAGYLCDRLLLTAKDGSVAEVWTTKELLDLTPFRDYMQHNRQSAEMLGVMKALKEANAEGFPAKLITREPQATAPSFTLTLLKADKRPVAVVVLEVPAGYKKQEGLLGMLPGMLPLPLEHQQTIQNALENLPPAQRRMLENLMRSRSGQ